MSTRKIRILYLMHVDWRWIKQRPHYLAEGLAGWADVLVLYKVMRKRRKLPVNPSKIARLPILPIPTRPHPLLMTLDALFQQAIISIVILFFRPDVVWLAYPTLLAYLPPTLRKRFIVYDCMDLATGFGGRATTLRRVEALEARLVSECALLLSSSANLAADLRTRYSFAKPNIVRNALSQPKMTNATKERHTSVARTPLRLAYVGTISTWMDWDAIRSVLERSPEISLSLIGPCDTEIPCVDRLLYLGVVAHDRLPVVLSQFDGFVMPFILSPLIQGVDPVKLYEYLSYMRPVFSVRYPEVERFSPFVYLYKDAKEFGDLIELLLSGKLCEKADAEATQAFLAANTWSVRSVQVRALLETALYGG